MTKKDYVLIASVLSNAMLCASESGANNSQATMIRFIACQFADKLANENPRFDRARFLKACGV